MAALRDVTPRPPDDLETRTIIDKLANFVARNGPEFEKMTMSKKSQDPKFSFLFGGEYHPYYRWKVELEKNHFDNHTIQPGPSISAEPAPPGLDTSSNDINFSSFIQTLNVTKQKEQTELDNQGFSDPLEVEFNSVLKPVMETCSKEAIASGKGWIFSHSRTPEECGKMAHFIMRKSLDLPGVDFNQKLHIVYLINDIVHHCLRKGANDLKQALETVIVQIFFNIFTSSPHNGDSLSKVLNIWESQEYLSELKLTQVKKLLSLSPSELPEVPPPATETIVIKPSIVLQSFATPTPPWQQLPNVATGFNPTTTPIPLWQQSSQPPMVPPWEQGPPPSGFNRPPVPWSNQNVSGPWTHPPPPPPPPAPPPGGVPATSQPTPLFSPNDSLSSQQTPSSSKSENTIYPPPPTGESKGDGMLANKETIDYNHQTIQSQMPPSSHPPGNFHQSIQVFDYQHRAPPSNWDMTHPPPPIPPHMGPPPPFPFPPNSRLPPPPHGFPPHEIPPPPIPYFDLPAGLMVPLVPLHEHGYKSIKPHMICLPPPQPPSERLLEAVEEFYCPPDDTKPRNEEGWEAKALLDFYEAKVKAKEAMRARGRDGTSRRPPPRRRSRSRSQSPRHRRRRSSSSRSRSRSYSPRHRRRSSRSPSSMSRSSSQSRSRSPRHKHRSYSRSRSSSPFTPTLEDVSKRRARVQHTIPQQSDKISEGNVGHQLLKRMGWEGAGLGAHGQGIKNPVKGGEIRDKQNQFAGVGVNMNDPFEQFRRNKSYTFNRRPPPGSS